MKKAKLIGLMAGITALAIGAGATYAWFTSTAEPSSLIVNAARINIANGEMTYDLDLKLPGEMVGFENWDLVNNSSRESIVEFSISAVDIDTDSALDPDREAELLALLNAPGNVVVSGIESGGNTYYHDVNTGKHYLWLGIDADGNPEQLDSAFSIKLKVPEELGGYYMGNGTVRSESQQNEQGAVITLVCQAYAVQGTEAAIADIFDADIAAEFAGDYK